MGVGVQRNQRFGLKVPIFSADAGAEPSKTICMVCSKTLEELETACERAECPLRPRQDQRLMCDP
jgi:hypothetical protein